MSPRFLTGRFSKPPLRQLRGCICQRPNEQCKRLRHSSKRCRAENCNDLFEGKCRRSFIVPTECLSGRLFSPRCSTFHCTLSHTFIFSPTSTSHPPTPHSWRGHTQSTNESTQHRLQEARFHRPSWIPVTMEISTTAVTHRCGPLDFLVTKCIN